MQELAEDEGLVQGEGWEGVIEDHGYWEGSGLVDGHPWYLHARGWRWAVAVAPKGRDAVDVVFGEVEGYYHEEAHNDPAGMTRQEVWGCVLRCLAEFRSVGFNVESGEIHDPALRHFAALGA